MIECLSSKQKTLDLTLPNIRLLKVFLFPLLLPLSLLLFCCMRELNPGLDDVTDESYHNGLGLLSLRMLMASRDKVNVRRMV